MSLPNKRPAGLLNPMPRRSKSRIPSLRSIGGAIIAVLSLFCISKKQNKVAVAAKHANGASVELDVHNGKGLSVRLIRAVDGDTILVDLNGKKERVRFHCVDTPESKHPDPSRNTELGKKASQFTKDVLKAAKIELVLEAKSSRQRDHYDRILAYIIIVKGSKRVNLNVLLVNEGWSKYETRWGRSSEFHEEFVAAQKHAKSKRLGVWK